MKNSPSRPVRVVLSRRRGWRMPDNTVKVCRPGPWGNPHKAGAAPLLLSVAEAVAAYEADLLSGRLKDRAGRPMVARLEELAGRNLACWCAATALCHADVLLRLANGQGRRTERRSGGEKPGRDADRHEFQSE